MLLFGVAIAALHVASFLLLFVFVAPGDYHLAAGGALGVGAGVTAYLLGARHAFDLDHIGAIDNVTRKLLGDGGRPLGVGFFFALGHSTVVLALGLLVGLGARGLGAAVRDDGSALHAVTETVGPLVSGAFLLAIGLVNLALLLGLLRSRGPLGRIPRRAARTVRASWQMYPLGLLFGLGFDTATEVALLALAGGAGAAGLPLAALVCLPLLFAAGMTLFDTVDGVLMRFAYGWASARPSRRAAYNLAVTGLSVALALALGTTELVSTLGVL
jgi:high-affinity nickel-transport protein